MIKGIHCDSPSCVVIVVRVDLREAVFEDSRASDVLPALIEQLHVGTFIPFTYSTVRKS